MPRTHYFPDDRVHYTWDAGTEPVLTVESGDTVVVTTRDVSDNQITPDSGSSAIDTLDWSRVYPLAGPIAVAGAQPGDTLAVDILDLHPQGWGWTAILPGLGLLPEEFPDAYLRIFDLTAGDVTYLREDIAIPVEPFFGTMGVCPAGASAQPVMPPGTFGGNMDTRQLVRGTTLYLPVQVEGALLLLRRRARRPGRRRGLRHRHRGADVRHAALPARARPHAARAPVPHGRPAHAARRPRGLLRHDGRRRRPLRGRAGRLAGDDRPPDHHARARRRRTRTSWRASSST